MSAEYDAATEIKAGLDSIGNTLECIYDELPTLRQLYAGMAMQGMLANSHAVYTVQTAEELAAVAAAAADALLAELNKDKS